MAQLMTHGEGRDVRTWHDPPARMERQSAAGAPPETSARRTPGWTAPDAETQRPNGDPPPLMLWGEEER